MLKIQKTEIFKNSSAFQFSGWAFGALGFIIGAVSLFFQFQSEEKSLSIELLSNTELVNRNDSIPRLAIYYDSVNLTANNESLLIATIRIRNNGDVDILKGDFDLSYPLSIHTPDATIVDNPKLLINEDDGYLSRAVGITLDSSSFFFNSFLLDKGEYFDVTFLYKLEKFRIPALTVRGKISGIDELKLTPRLGIYEISDTVAKQFLWGMVIFFTLLTSIAYFTIREIYSRRRRSFARNRDHARIASLLESSSALHQELDRFSSLYEEFTNETYLEVLSDTIHAGALPILYELVDNPELLQWVFQDIALRQNLISPNLQNLKSFSQTTAIKMVNHLTELNLIVGEQDQEIETDFKKFVNDFRFFLKFSDTASNDKDG